MKNPSPYAVVIGASAGGIETLKRLVAKLPEDFCAPLFVVQHLPARFPSLLPDILTRAGPLRAKHPRDGELIQAPGIYVAPSDHHLLIEDGHIAVKRGPHENRFRPSVDALFRSAAYTYREGAIGVVLSGALNDGTSGLWTIKRLGGIAIVQDPIEAQVPDMVLSALREVEIDHTAPVDNIASILSARIAQPPGPPPELPSGELKTLEIEHAIAAGVFPLEAGALELGTPSRYTCPECNGVLNRIIEGPITRYRCHTGHAYSQNALLEGNLNTSEERLAQTVTVIEERALLLEEMAVRQRRQQNGDLAASYSNHAKQARKLADGLRKLIVDAG